MSVQNGIGKMLIGVLSTILVAVGGYSADTITTLVSSNHELSARISSLESKIEMSFTEKDLLERMKKLELNIDGVVHQ